MKKTPFIIVSITILICCIWITLVIIALQSKGGLNALYALNLNEIGDAASGFFSSLAFIGLIATVFIQGFEIRRQIKEKERERYSSAKRIVGVAMWKITSMFSDFSNELQYTEPLYAKSAEKPRNNTWTLISERSWVPAPVTFDASERVMLMAVNDAEFLRDVMSLEKMHHRYIQTRKNYDELRISLMNRSEINSVNDDLKVFIRPSKGIIEYDVIRANLTLKDLRDETHVAYETAKSVIKKFEVFSREYFPEAVVKMPTKSWKDHV
ncbi:hypothetical protein [Rhizobium alvei]|uniref:Uncharacterized protein n=1 Tax=Rhizobium alvei TaxID=1132659 RepID=A0ABT8YJX1_9HYPH|nr:hypothetical protein [Rhizobium alvei]MDO6964006.1 hypothetical protein [Rhizobium alvei]